LGGLLPAILARILARILAHILAHILARILARILAHTLAHILAHILARILARGHSDAHSGRLSFDTLLTTIPGLPTDQKQFHTREHHHRFPGAPAPWRRGGGGTRIPPDASI